MTAEHRAGPSASVVRRLAGRLGPRWTDPGWIAFVLNRLTGLVLVAYLLAHFVVLSRLASGASGWNELLAIFGSTPFLVGDVLLIAAVVFHGLNGLRVIGMTMGHGTARPALLVAVVVGLSAALAAVAGWAILLS
jgi:succinate dehydrogenase / fumarate reductase cytochrome b subunit